MGLLFSILYSIITVIFWLLQLAHILSVTLLVRNHELNLNNLVSERLYYFQLYSIVLFSFVSAISAYLLCCIAGKKPCVACFCLCFLFYFYSLITFLTMMFLLVVTFLPVPPFPPPPLLPPALH